MGDLRLQRLKSILPSYEERARTRQQDDLVISRQSVQGMSRKVNVSFESLCVNDMPALPIPTKGCVPIMSTQKQVLEYESKFLDLGPEEIQTWTVADVLYPYSHINPATLSGKLQFLIEFFNRIRNKTVNLDVAVICNSHRSEVDLIRGLNGQGFNFKAISSLLPKKRIYGVIVKTRKNNKTVKPVIRTDVDIIMVYDSAVECPKEKLDMFQGATYEDPLIVHLSSMDTADIRLYNSPWHKNLSWPSKLTNIPLKEKQKIFYQQNRKQPNDSEVFSWNEFVANQVLRWASSKLDQDFSFEFPQKKHPLAKMYLSFSFCHPRPLVDKNKASAAQAVAIASPQQQNSVTNAVTVSKKKTNVNNIPIFNANQYMAPSLCADSSTGAAPASAAFTETAKANVNGKGKVKAQISSSIPSSTSIPNSVVIDLTDMEAKDSGLPAATTTTVTSQHHSTPRESVHPDHLAQLESTMSSVSSVPLKRAKDLDMNDDHDGTSGKRAKDNTTVDNEISRANVTTDKSEANGGDKPLSTTADDTNRISGFSNEEDAYKSFLQEALQQFQQEMLNISINL